MEKEKREIKFRYIFDATHNNLGIQAREFTLDQIEENHPYDFMSCSFTTSAKITRLQYTGLKDKNGVEIYEGDILLVGDEKDNNHINPCYHQRNELVVFYNLGFYLESSYIKGHHNIISSSYMVIGNIYQNPELHYSSRFTI